VMVCELGLTIRLGVPVFDGTSVAEIVAEV
jgi:hypothetical protein